MKVEEINKLGRKELRARADECFRRAESPGVGMGDRPGLLLEAQFYMRELEHRADSRTSLRDLLLELAVIGLILWEIRLGYRQERLQSSDFVEQQQVLKNMQTSSAATAATLTSLAGTSEAMNAALQKQLALFYDVSVNAVIDSDTKRLTFVNNGRTNVVLWGVKYSDQAPDIEKKEGRVIAPNGSYQIDLTRPYNMMVARIPKGTTGLVPFRLYLKNERREEFVEDCYFAVSWDKDMLKLGVQIASIMPEHWSSEQTTSSR